MAKLVGHGFVEIDTANAGLGVIREMGVVGVSCDFRRDFVPLSSLCSL